MRRIGLIMLLLRHASSLAVRTALRDAVAALHKDKVPEARPRPSGCSHTP